jgi:hypothetical protein
VEDGLIGGINEVTLNAIFVVSGDKLKQLEVEKGIVIRFVIGHR